MYIEECNNPNDLIPLAQEWIGKLHADDYGVDVDLDTVVADLAVWMKGEGIVLVAKEGDEILGVFAVFTAPSYLGKQKIALEKYWYSRDGSHFAGPRLYAEGVRWAKSHGCSHLITNGSKLVSEARHNSICRFLEKTGAKQFETMYIYKLGEN